MTPNTVSYPDFVRKLFNRSSDPSKNFAHAVLGIKTEIQELLEATDRVNAVEELGDLAFYVEALFQVINDTLPDEVLDLVYVQEQAASEVELFNQSTKQRDLLDHTVNELCDQAKRWVGYEKRPSSLAAAFVLAVTAVSFARGLARWPTEDVTTDHIKAVNMAKLLKRYPGGDFDQFRALQRDLGAERATLETAVLG